MHHHVELNSDWLYQVVAGIWNRDVRPLQKSVKYGVHNKDSLQAFFKIRALAFHIYKMLVGFSFKKLSSSSWKVKMTIHNTVPRYVKAQIFNKCMIQRIYAMNISHMKKEREKYLWYCAHQFPPKMHVYCINTSNKTSKTQYRITLRCINSIIEQYSDQLPQMGSAGKSQVKYL